MLFEQHYCQDLLTPTINDGGVHKLDSSLTSLDFYLVDDINAYLPHIQSKPTTHTTTTTHDLINDSLDNNHSQQHDDFFADLDLSQFDEKSDLIDSISIDDLDLEKWISQASFPSPPMDADIDQIGESFLTFSEYPTVQSDMVVPPSPPLSSSSSSPATPSSTSSSPAPTTSKRTKLSTVERKLRKKSQNKTAAEKYRIKKKTERQILLERHHQLKNVNQDLKTELENLTFRVEKFKQLYVQYLQMNVPTSE